MKHTEVTRDEMLAALGKGRKRGNSPRAAAIPRAAPVERDGLSTMLKAGWSYAFQGSDKTHRFHKQWGAAGDTGYWPTVAEAVAEAKRLMKESGEK